MKTIRINTHTFIDVYAEDEYLMVRYDNNPNLDKKIPFAYVIGYHFYKADKNSRGELFIQNKKERDIKVTFAPSFNEDASKIEPVLAGILENRKSKSSSANNKPLAKSDQVNNSERSGVSSPTSPQIVTFNGAYGTITCYEKYFESFLDTVYYANIKKTEWIKLTDNYCLSLTLTNGTVVQIPLKWYADSDIAVSHSAPNGTIRCKVEATPLSYQTQIRTELSSPKPTRRCVAGFTARSDLLDRLCGVAS